MRKQISDKITTFFDKIVPRSFDNFIKRIQAYSRIVVGAYIAIIMVFWINGDIPSKTHDMLLFSTLLLLFLFEKALDFIPSKISNLEDEIVDLTELFIAFLFILIILFLSMYFEITLLIILNMALLFIVTIVLYTKYKKKK